MKKLLVLSLLMFFVSSCVPALIVGVAYSATKSREDRRLFMEDYNKTNIERENKGLKPLNWCKEAYRFDKGWALEKKECEGMKETKGTKI